MLKTFISCLVGILLVSIAGFASANIIYDNEVTDPEYGWLNSPGQHVADDFQLQDTNWVTDVHLQGSFSNILGTPQPTNDFYIRIYNMKCIVKYKKLYKNLIQEYNTMFPTQYESESECDESNDTIYDEP